MNTLKRIDGVIYTQNIDNIPIEERVFVKEIFGISATSDYYRPATKKELEDWEDYKLLNQNIE